MHSDKIYMYQKFLNKVQNFIKLPATESTELPTKLF